MPWRNQRFTPLNASCIKQPPGRPPLRRAPLLVALAVAVVTSGCLDFGGLGAPDYPVSRTPLKSNEWMTDSRFTVQVMQAEAVEVRIEAKPAEGSGLAPLATSGLSNANDAVSIDLPDGTWTVTYFVGGHKWETFTGVRVDTTPPSLDGIETLVEAPQGSATIGGGVTIGSQDRVQVVDQSTGAVVASALPAQVSGLSDGVHAYDVVATDPAGNEAVATVQVLVGSANELPAGRFTAGIVARYSLSVQLWDISDLDAYPSPSEARAAAPGMLGTGEGITPEDPAVQQAIEDAGVTSGMSTAEVALALYRWMFDHLEYDRSRLSQDTLLTPAQTLQDSEDADGADADKDGLADDGSGNGVRGGVCRDLAALYVSLLRGAGVPARLVAGYLAGTVDGFHAWVEFYGGSGGGSGPWVPVDVSGIGSSDDASDDDYSEAAMLQAFAIALPEHLPLRALTSAQEQTEWSSAATVSYTKPQRSADPRVEFTKDACNTSRCGGFEEEKALCVDLQTRERSITEKGACRKAFIDGFVSRARWVLDYGVEVTEPVVPGTTITVGEVFPDSAATTEWLSYGGQFSKDATTGRIKADLSYH